MQGEEASNNKKNILIILSGKCDKKGNLNSLRKVGSNENTVLDIQIESLGIDFIQKYVVLGEKHNNWNKKGFKKIINTEWKNSKSGYSLSLALENINTDADIWILYSDILFRDIKVPKNLLNKNLIYTDNKWDTRIANRKTRDNSLIELIKDDENYNINLFFNGVEKDLEKTSEMCGIIKITNNSFLKIKSIIKNIGHSKLKQFSCSELFEESRIYGEKFKSVNISGKYCQLNIDDDLIRYFLGTKAETLEKLKMIGLKNGEILDQFNFTIEDWNNNKDLIINKIINKFNKNKIIIRSSCFKEDQSDFSGAGKFESELSVECNSKDINKSITKVINSYGKDISNKNQILVQKFLENVDLSGVAFSRMIESNGPYISINIGYIDTEQVTSGNSCNEYFISRENINLVKDLNIKKIIQCLLEIENLLNFRLIDMEFALWQNKLYVLQIRPLIIKNKFCDDKLVNKYIKESNIEIKNLFKEQDTIYSLMSDWNPAEIIGKLPSNLSSSIYKLIITDTNWSISRKLDGYKSIKGSLLKNILGTDYIDVMKSIKSFIPNDLQGSISNKIIKKAYKSLFNQPSLHDKIEFEIIPTCIDLNWEKWERYFKDILTKSEIEIYRSSLVKNTRKIINEIIITEDQKSINSLIKISSSNNKNKLKKAIELLDEIRKKHAIDFARSARRAFIVTSWIRSSLEKGIISKSAEIGLYKSLNTISREFLDDISNQKISIETIYKKYGHLRPNSYDIQSKCYLYRNINKDLKGNKELNKYDKDIQAWNNQKENLYKQINLFLDYKNNNLIEVIIKQNIILREKNKFEFTKLLSAALELIAEYTNEIGFNRNEASFISINTLINISNSHYGKSFEKKIIEEEIKTNKINRKIFELIYKPDIFINGNELLIDKSLNCRATYIGSSIIESKAIILDNIENEKEELINNKIVCIENADPGYDFIFGYNIRGLITMYGGSNSHMTIRCSELNVTAAIGIGHKEFMKISNNSYLQINPKLKTIKKIN